MVFLLSESIVKEIEFQKLLLDALKKTQSIKELLDVWSTEQVIGFAESGELGIFYFPIY